MPSRIDFKALTQHFLYLCKIPFPGLKFPFFLLAGKKGPRQLRLWSSFRKERQHRCVNNLMFVFCFKLHFMSHAHCCIFQARGEIPRLPNGLPEKSSRPDRPRARDRPKPRRRPRPKETTAGETRRSRSAPAQSSPPVPLPPTHTAQHEGFLFRKIDIDGQKKSSNRWGFLV